MPGVKRDAIRENLDGRLAVLRAEHEGLDLRQKILQLAELLIATRRLNVAVVEMGVIHAEARVGRTRLDCLAHVGVKLDAVELEVMSRISDYGRRICELRTEEGYTIFSGPGNDPEGGTQLEPDHYVPAQAEPDRTAAHRWHIAHEIRNKKHRTCRKRILEYFQINVGEIITTEEIRLVGRKSESTRRARELRTEEGYPVSTHYTGRPDLKPGKYVLKSAVRVVPEQDHHITAEVAKAVFSHNASSCRLCGWNRDSWTRADARFPELHRYEYHVSGGSNSADNLLILCNRCHDNIHAGRVQPPVP